MTLTAEHIDDSIARALRGESHLDPAVLGILGFATPTMRHMFSNLCHLDGLTYLECGVYAGASFCAACSNNNILPIGIDNFSQAWHEGRDIRAEFAANKARFCDAAAIFIDSDCFAPGLLLREFVKRDIFFFDGDHARQAQARALPHFFDHLSDTFLFIVDDFHWEDVQKGTQAGFDALADRVTVIQQWALSGNKAQDDEIFHNGLGLFLCKKNAS